MEIPKEKILELLRSRGDLEKVKQADQELPESVHPDRDMELLSKYGVEPTELLGKLGGGKRPRALVAGRRMVTSFSWCPDVLGICAPRCTTGCGDRSGRWVHLVRQLSLRIERYYPSGS